MPIQTPRLLTTALGACALSLLGACGGGGDSSTGSSTSSGSGSTTSTSTTSTTTTTTPTTTTASPVTARLSGVAALGAPMSGARVRVLDATGAQVGATSTNAADGSYAVSLQPAVAPLIVQAAGTDANGAPVVLHSTVPTLAGSTAVANITPLSDAIVALTLGADPKSVFAGVAAQPKLIEGLAKPTAASDFVKTLVKTNLSDAKTGDAKKLDLLGDGSFAANKTGVDLALETLSIGYGASSKGAAQLQLGNKLAGTPLEVTVDLDSARTELAKATGATPANAITSTLKSTTSPTTLMANLATLDDLVTAINKVIAESSSGDAGAMAAALGKAGLLAKYTQHNGSAAIAMATRIAGFAAKRMQLGRMQVTGCADDTIAKTGCARVAVAARVNDSSGAQADMLSDAVSYSATATPKWQLIGNGQAADVAAQSVAWLALGSDGSAVAGSDPNPLVGVQILVGSAASSATVQTPGGYVLPLVSCQRPTLCTSAAAASASAAGAGASADATDGSSGRLATAGLHDDTVFQGLNAWLGSADVALSARYKVNLVLGESNSAQRSASLRGAFTAAPAGSRFPTLDDVQASQVLPGTALLTQTTLAWTKWAAANTDMRLVFLRSVLTDGSGAVFVTDTSPRSWAAGSAELAAPALPDGFAVATITLWLAAVDTQGRWYYTSYALL